MSQIARYPLDPTEPPEPGPSTNDRILLEIQHERELANRPLPSVASSALRTGTIFGQAGDFLNSLTAQSPPDPNFNPAGVGTFEEITQGIDPKYYSLLGSAQSSVEAATLRAQIFDRQESELALQRAGYVGIAATIAAAAFDPVYVGVGSVAAGAISATSKAVRVSRGVAALRAGAITTAVTAPIDVGVAAISPDEYDLYLSTAGNFLGGAIGGALASRSTRQAVAREMSHVQTKEALEYSERLGVASQPRIEGPDFDPGVASEPRFTDLDFDPDDVIETGIPKAYTSRNTVESGSLPVTAAGSAFQPTVANRNTFITGPGRGELFGDYNFEQRVIAAKVYRADPQRWQANASEFFKRTGVDIDSAERDAAVTLAAKQMANKAVLFPRVYHYGDIAVSNPDILKQVNADKGAVWGTGWTVAGVQTAQGASLGNMTNAATTTNLLGHWVNGRLTVLPGADTQVAARKSATIITFAQRMDRLEDRALEDAAEILSPGADPKRFIGQNAVLDIRREAAGISVRGSKTNAAMRQLISRTIRDAARYAKRAGVKGFDKFALSDTYIPRIFAREPTLAFIARTASINVDTGLGVIDESSEAARVFGEMFSAIQPNLELSESRLLGKMYATSVLHANQHNVSQLTTQIADLDIDGIKTTLQEARNAGRLTDTEMTRLMNAFLRSSDNAPRRASRAATISEVDPIQFTANDGTTGQITLAELLVNDPVELVSTYVNDVYGLAAEQEVLYQVGMAFNGSPFESRGGLFQALADEDTQLVQRGLLTDARARQRAESWAFTFDRIRGVDPHKSSPNTRSFFAKVNAATDLFLGGGLGIAQLPELSRAIMTSGRPIASLLDTFTLSRLGDRSSDPLVRELASMYGFGQSDALARAIPYRAEDLDRAMGASRLETNLVRLQRRAHNISGLTWIQNRVYEITGINVVNTTVDALRDGKAINGIDRVFTIRERSALMREMANVTRDPRSGRVMQTNLRTWTDQVLAARFASYVHARSLEVVGDTTVASLGRWMTQPAARSILKYKTFMVSAWSNHLLKQAYNLDDKMLALRNVSAMLTGAAAYVAYTHLDAVGREDREQFLEERLTPQTIAAQAFARTGLASGVPPFIDAVSQSIGQGTQFAFGNRSVSPVAGLATPAALGVVATGLRAGGSLIAAAVSDDNPLTERDAKSVERMFPVVGSHPLARGVLNWLARQVGEPE